MYQTFLSVYIYPYTYIYIYTYTYINLKTSICYYFIKYEFIKLFMHEIPSVSFHALDLLLYLIIKASVQKSKFIRNNLLIPS